MFLFGATEHEIKFIREGVVKPSEINHDLKFVLDEIKAGIFGPISDIIRDLLE